MVEISQELIEIKPESELDVFTKPDGAGIDPFLAKIRAQIDQFIPDMSSDEGRAEIKSFAHKVTKSKTYLEGIGEALAKKQKAIPKLIDATRKKLNDTLDLWRDEVRKPLTDWERAEKKRVSDHADRIARFSAWGQPGDSFTLDELHAMLIEVNALDTASCEEFSDEYVRALSCAAKGLKEALARREKYDSDQAELLRLRTERDAQLAREHEARIAEEAGKEAIRKFEAKRIAERAAAVAAQEASDRRESDLRDQAAAAEKKATEAIAAAQREAEQKETREKQEQEKREANKRHCGAINRKAVAALIEGGVNEEVAKIVITMIAQGKVPSVSISY